MKIVMTQDEYSDLADFMNDRFVARVKEAGHTYSIRQMAEEIGGDVSEVTVRRLLNKKAQNTNLETKTIRALVRKYGPVILTILNLHPDQLYHGGGPDGVERRRGAPDKRANPTERRQHE